MKVKDLIDKLKKYPDGTVVFCMVRDLGDVPMTIDFNPISEVGYDTDRKDILLTGEDIE